MLEISVIFSNQSDRNDSHNCDCHLIVIVIMILIDLPLNVDVVLNWIRAGNISFDDTADDYN